MRIKTLEDLEKIGEEGLKSLHPDRVKISVGMATCGLATGANEVYEAIEKTVTEKKLDILLAKTGCLGFCQKEPIVDILAPGMPKLIYMQMTPEKAVEVIDAIARNEVKRDYLLCKIEEEELIIEGSARKYDISTPNDDLTDITTYQEVPFFAKQRKIVLRNCGFINPESIEEYIARGGYKSLYKALTAFSPEDVIEQVKRSGLRGRGGAGFPTGDKWEFTRKAKGEPKYVVCNADEGDPGAYMDRAVLEGDPHSVIEGMLIGAYAIGASEGYIYVRTEYPLAIERLKQAIAQAKEYRLLGENIFGTDFSFNIEIREGSGAFVCGEETSLIHSIEGKPPEPRQRPPFPAQKGLWGKPTNINNVETWANIPVIIARGADWFSQFGTEKSKGTKVFSLVGKVNNTGLVEVPMGITLREIIYDIGGGIPEGKQLKAVQTGGPSGGCIPASLIDLPVDYERLTEAGSIMGSGGMVVMDEDTCVVDIAKFFLTFTRDESCGKCSSCREGSEVLLEILTRISEGEGEEEDVLLLEELSEVVKSVSLCGLGQTLPNPVLSTLRYFKEEYVEHIREKRCSAKVCRELVAYYIDPERCQACLICARNCPVDAIYGEKGIVHVIDQEKCIKCGTCFEVCPPRFRAVKKISGEPVPPSRGKIKVKRRG
jgi:NADH:ubiquinone oxidoreductase subunit F (NADH-binding)/NAD-dependent dihydropyrimidine dehydrogenase PreA subunit/(2Fe-2S) ferredoxin